MTVTLYKNEVFNVPNFDADFRVRASRQYGIYLLWTGSIFLFTYGCDSSQQADVVVSDDSPSVSAADPDGEKISFPRVNLRGGNPTVLKVRRSHPFDMKQMQPRQDEECCSNPGAIADCWWLDAKRDGVTCVDSSECSGSNTCDKTVEMDGVEPPNGWGVCTCSTDDDCGNGICTDGLCGPSFCNGYLVCSCWGGCTEANTGEYENPQDMCADIEAGFAGACCEGNYPVSNNGKGLGFCSPNCDGMGGVVHCETTADCIQPLPNPYSSDCLQWVCDDGLCRGDYYNASGFCSDRVQMEDPSYWGTAVRNEGADVFSCFEGRCDNIGNCLSVTDPANDLYCDDDDDNFCTDERCQNGICTHDYSETENDPCDLDENPCTMDRCNGSGVCIKGVEPECDDENRCTDPDGCEDPDPTDDDYIDWQCFNTPLNDGINLESYWPESVYEDTDVCSDIICYFGNETVVPNACTPPGGLHLECNEFRCDELGEEDNCTVFPIRDYLDCDDNNGCTVEEVCGSGVCGSATTRRKVCDDGNVCTVDSCIDGPAGICRFEGAPLDGNSCDDGDPCTGEELNIPVNDFCSGGICTAGSNRICTAPAYNDQCNIGGCNHDTGVCEKIPQTGASCDDGDPCTVSDICTDSGICMGPAKDCHLASDQCNDGVCEAGTGNCIPSPVLNGTDCTANDGKGLCTPYDTCQNGICVADTAEVICEPSDVCNTRYCDVDTGNCAYDNSLNLNKSCEGILDTESCTVDQCVGYGADYELTCTRVADSDISSWYDGGIFDALTIDGNLAEATTLTDATLGQAKGYLVVGDTSDQQDYYSGPGTSGWNGKDQIWKINYTGTVSQTLYFSGCLYGGVGSYDAQAILLSCSKNEYAQNDDACGDAGMPEFSVTMDPGKTYFLIMDGYDLGVGDAYKMAIYYDTCSDGIENGDETAVDSGGLYCCSNGMQNGDEEAVDRGGSCCQDGAMDGDETEVDCGGAYCDACVDPCENGELDTGEWAVDCGGSCPIECATNVDCDPDYVCNTEISPCGSCLPIACSGASDPELTIGEDVSIAFPMTNGCIDMLVNDTTDLNHIHYGDREVKLQMYDTAPDSGGCDFNTPNYTYVYSTKYCLTYQGVSGKSIEDFIACPEWGYTTGSGRVVSQWDEIFIPVEQYTRSARISFIDHGDNCTLNTNIYWQ